MSVFFCCTLLLFSSIWALDAPPSPIEAAFLSSNIVADAVPKSPAGYVKVDYPGGVQVILGNVLIPSQVEQQPVVTWPASIYSYYTLAFVDLDVFSRWNPNMSEFRHWLIGNIPGNDVRRGDVLAPYFKPTPPAEGGTHRYVFLVYEQIEKITFHDFPNLNVTSEDRSRFCVREFSRRYNLKEPIAGNFFQSRFAGHIC